MRILVVEYITGGGMLNEELPDSLVAEGDMMLRALVEDLARLNHVTVTVTRDPRIPAHDLPCGVHYVDEPEGFMQSLPELFRGVDAVWPIAPETGGALETITSAIVDSGRVLLNSRLDAVRIAASKRETIHALSRYGLPVVPVHEPDPGLFDIYGTLVVKPDDGVGCVGAQICHAPQELARALKHDRQHNYIAQPYVEGTALSLSLLFRDGHVGLLSCNRQRIALMDLELKLLGVVVNDCEIDGPVGEQILAGIGAAVPGLWGYVGVDLIVAHDGPKILEINPRLTLSYVGLNRALRANPAELVLNLLDPDQYPETLLREVSPGERTVHVEAGAAHGGA